MQQPSISSEMQAMNSLLHQIPLQDRQNAGNTCTHQQIQNPNFHPTLPHDHFLEQMLYSLPSSAWTDLSDEMARSSNLEKNNVGLHYDEIPASKLRQHPINGGGNQSELKMMMQQQQQMMMAGRIGAAAGVMVRPSAAGDAGGFTVPMSLKSSHQNEIVAFKSARRQQGAEGSVQARYNGFSGGSLHGTNHLATALNQPRHVNPPQTQNYGAPEVVAINQVPARNESNIGTAGQPKQKVRARRGQATDPHSIAERLRRERIAERMRALQGLVPTANKTDKASMLDEIIDYVKFLQLQVKVLSVSQLGGAAAAADISSEGGGVGDCIQTSAHGPQTNDSLTVMEHQVAKLMEEDLRAAMQYLQEKGLCLMPISLATAISTTTTCRSSYPMISNNSGYPIGKHREGPSSPSMSVLTVQSATKGNGGVNGFVKDAASVSKP